MRFRSTHKWPDLVSNNNLLFLAQRAEELLFDYTLDSYKPSALNPCTLCNEAIDLSSEIEKGVIDKNNLSHVLDELSYSLINDEVVKNLLDLDVCYYVVDHDKNPLDFVVSRLNLLGRTIERRRYLEKCTEMLIKAVGKSEKKSIDSLLSKYLSCLISSGVHKSYLMKVTLDFFYNGHHCKDGDHIKKYLAQLNADSHLFELILKSSNLMVSVDDTLEPFRVERCDKLPDEFKSKAHCFQKNNDQVFIKVVGIEARDEYSARENAEKRLTRLRDLFTLFHHKDQLRWDDEALLTQCCSSDVKLVTLPKNPMEKGRDSKPEAASQKLKKLLRKLVIRGSDFQKFISAVDFHGIGINNPKAESQLLNLWISIETIVPTTSKGAKISQISKGLSSFLIVNYLGRIFDQLARDLYNWNRSTTWKLLKKINADEGATRAEKLFLLVTDPKYLPLREDLYKKLKDFHLLRFRIFDLSQKLNSSTKILSFIKNHEKKVQWQIRRFYRTRNLIVHSGATSQHIKALIENAHDYLDQVIEITISMSMGPYKITSIRQAFDLATALENKMIEHLKTKPKIGDINSTLMLNEHECMA